MTTEPLKPCPFCGGEAEFKLALNRRHPWFIECTKCYVATEGSAYENNEYNANKWNTRQKGEDCEH